MMKVSLIHQGQPEIDVEQVGHGCGLDSPMTRR